MILTVFLTGRTIVRRRAEWWVTAADDDVPGCPEFAACTASIARVRMVFTVSWSIG
jgi:hypothetical protein